MLARRHLATLFAAGALSALASAWLAADEAKTAEAKRPPGEQAAQPTEQSVAPADRKYVTETARGKVVWLADALERKFGVRTEVNAAHSAVVLETPDGRLVPIVPDTRGWAFTVDDRLRDIDLELLVRRYEQAPHVQVIRVQQRKPDGLYEIDYWCDICAIPMFILKPCECCQGETRLREQKVEAVPSAPAAAPR